LELFEEGELGVLSEEQQSVIGIMHRNGRQLLGLIEDVLAVASVERSSFGVRFAPVDMRAIVGEVCETIAVRLREGGITLAVDVPEEQCYALGDAEQLERVVLNVATNAVKFTPPGGTVRVAVRYDGPMIRVEVADTGIGISEADQEHIFDRFYRATQDGKKPPSGTGLGLFIVKTVIEAHGGSVELDSEPGGGTRVVCLLPAARITAEATDPTESANRRTKGREP
jgi:signal transduction histidine kinase